MRKLFSLAAAGFLVATMAGCAASQAERPGRAVAVLHPTKGNDASGVVRFQQVSDGVKVTAELNGLAPGSKHGLHVHAFGDCSADDGTSAGGHYNPAGVKHDLPPNRPRHAGDLGNVTVGPTGDATYERKVSNITIAGRHNPVLGRGVILHGQEDDGGQPTGNAGARIACGVIGKAE